MNSKKIFLVTGANGQLGMELQALAGDNPLIDFLFVSREQLSITDKYAVNEYFAANNIAVCINCAAYTAVDKAETEKEKAFDVNATGAGNLAAAAKIHEVKFIHISTDYVFAGNGTMPYQETDDTHPINVYAASKLEGEKMVLQSNPESVILRTSWVYSSYGKNFVKTMMRLMSEKESIGVVADQMGSPTYAADLAAAIMVVAEEEKSVPGVYHYCNAGVISWFDFAIAIKELLNSSCIVNPIVTDDYPTPALRPHYSALDTAKFTGTFNLPIPAWRESLAICLKKIALV